jgi:hypothetical protein
VLKERMAYIAAATNLLLPLPHQAAQMSHQEPVAMKSSPPILEPIHKIPDSPQIYEEDGPNIADYIETTFDQKSYNQSPPVLQGGGHHLVQKIIPQFTTDPRYPNISQQFLIDCHNEAETAQQNERSRNVTKETEFRDRVFVRLIFNKIFSIAELVGRSVSIVEQSIISNRNHYLQWSALERTIHYICN